MKQKTLFDSNYNELEYHEIDSDGTILFSKYTSYYYDQENGKFSDKIFEINCSDGSYKHFNRKGYITAFKMNNEALGIGLTNPCEEIDLSNSENDIIVANTNNSVMGRILNTFRIPAHMIANEPIL